MRNKEVIGKLIELREKYKEKVDLKKEAAAEKYCEPEEIVLPGILPSMDLIKRGDMEFFNDYFLRKVEKLEWNGVNDMALNIIFSSFDCGMRLGYTWRDIVEEPLHEFKRRAEEIGKEQFEPLVKMTKEWNETGEI